MVPVNAIVAYGDVWAKLHTFLNFAVVKRDWFEVVSSFPIIREG
jgi:hypothetical protein